MTTKALCHWCKHSYIFIYTPVAGKPGVRGISLKRLVGARGFEPATPGPDAGATAIMTSKTKRSDRRHHLTLGLDSFHNSLFQVDAPEAGTADEQRTRRAVA